MQTHPLNSLATLGKQAGSALLATLKIGGELSGEFQINLILGLEGVNYTFFWSRRQHPARKQLKYEEPPTVIVLISDPPS